MTKPHHPKKRAFDRTRTLCEKHWLKGLIVAGIGLIASGVFYELGTWSAENALDWCKHKHLVDDQQQVDLNHWHWAIPRMQAAQSNDAVEINDLKAQIAELKSHHR
jgi:hypothetical protein